MISIIIPCKNRINKIKLCIDSINESIIYAKQNNVNEDFELIVVNDHSDEGFKENLLSIFPEIRIVDSDGNGPGYARNLGIEKSLGKYLFFTDSDCVVSKDWILVGYNSFIDSKKLVIQGVPWLFQKNENVYLGSQEEKLYEIMFKTYLFDNCTKMTDSRNLLIDKDIVKILGREVFSEKTNKATAESRVFGNRCIKNGITILFDEKVKIYHEDSLDMISVCRQKYRHGSGRVEIWDSVPDFTYLEDRYFTKPINNGVEKEYIVPAHFAFLLGYFQTLNDKLEYEKFMKFAYSIFDKYRLDFNNYEYLQKMLEEKIW